MLENLPLYPGLPWKSQSIGVSGKRMKRKLPQRLIGTLGGSRSCLKADFSPPDFRRRTSDPDSGSQVIASTRVVSTNTICQSRRGNPGFPRPRSEIWGLRSDLRLHFRRNRLLLYRRLPAGDQWQAYFYTQATFTAVMGRDAAAVEAHRAFCNC